ncbi:MAG: NAD(P)(+) transhydrogenase (Re/Si-specific) subunit alpha [Micavibrio sp.]|nr:NAD(P)(+) transhydrogenase (Re/Si-specific) subunit alpha [Micavibrio sp.]|tara:strand:+ start:2268 stop:3512 length:1245 start_codon:yes stop_codon:yes gene_type:complete
MGLKIAVLKETAKNENRVAATPDTIKKYIAMGFSVAVEKDAGLNASFLDAMYKDIGATIVANATAAVKDADIILSVQSPEPATLSNAKKGAILIGILNPYKNNDGFKAYNSNNVTAIATEFMPRISRAQSMDVLSSQSNLAGYRAVIDAASTFSSAFPMMMTAAGTVPPAKVFVMGAGVAGLQAIATAKRLGAVVSATDVRLAAKEQVQSLGANFIMVEDEEAQQAETSGGYAKEMSDAYKKKQAALVAETIKKQDIVITTALIPGRPAPVLVTEEMVKSMKPGSVIVDLAVEQGGNCPISEPDKIVEKHGVKLIGYTNMAARVAVNASALYAKNLLTLITYIYDAEAKALNIDLKDEITGAIVLTQSGKTVHERFKAPATATATAAPKASAKKASAKKKPAAKKTTTKTKAKS